MTALDLLPLYQAVADGSFAEHIDAHPELLQADAAEAARDDVRSALAAGRADIARVAATARALILLRLGDRAGALHSRLEADQALFLLADDLETYDQARQDALLVGGLALETESRSLPFRSWVLAADCAWFAADLAAQSQLPSAEERHLVALRDTCDALEAAGPLAEDPDERRWLERLASLVCAVANASMARVWPDDQALPVDALLRRLARAGASIPVDLLFDDAGGPGKAAQVAADLAELDARYGAG